MSKLTLSEFAERVHGMLWADGWHDLDETADRLEEELSEIDRTRCHEPEELDDGGCYDRLVALERAIGEPLKRKALAERVIE